MPRAILAAVLVAVAIVIIMGAPWRVEMCGETEAVVVRSEVRAQISQSGRTLGGVQATPVVETGDGALEAMQGPLRALAVGTRVRAARSCAPTGAGVHRLVFLEVLEAPGGALP